MRSIARRYLQKKFKNSVRSGTARRGTLGGTRRTIGIEASRRPAARLLRSEILDMPYIHV